MPGKKIVRRGPKTVKKSSKKGTDKRQNSHLKALTASHNLTTRVLQKMMNTHSQGYLAANEKEAGLGQLDIAYRSDSHSFRAVTFPNGRLPMFMVNLTQCRNALPSGQRFGPGMFVYTGHASSTSFASIEAQEVIQAQDASSINESGVNTSFPHALCRWTKANLLLWGAKNRKLRYTLRIVSLKDKVLMPEFNDGGTYSTLALSNSSLDHNTKVRGFYDMFLKGEMSNPVFGKKDANRLKQEYKTQYKILWEKTYAINEQSADYDERPHKLVKIFRPINRVVDFYTTPSVSSISNLENAEVPYTLQNATEAYPFLQEGQNLYLMITCDQTLDQAPVGNDADGTFAGTRADHLGYLDILTETSWSRYAQM